jgi:tetratricopeptide (TPR) repeat protein
MHSSSDTLSARPGARVPIDREATLKQAEKLLRQGRLDGAIAEYVRLVEEQPQDWNSINALGDLHVRAGQPDKAVEQFTHIADFMMREGFVPRAAALYKKVLKIRKDDEHSQLQLASITARQGLFADAKAYLKQVAEQRVSRGDSRGALEIAINLGTVDPDDGDGKVSAAHAARDLGDSAQAVTLLKEAADIFEKNKEAEAARAALAELLDLDPADDEIRNRLARAAMETGDDDALEALLTPAAAGDNPRLLLMLAKRELLAGQLDAGRAALTRLFSTTSAHAEAGIAMACGLADHGHVDAAYLCTDLIADVALLDLNPGGAAAALRAFSDRVPTHVAALLKLVEICVDGNLEEFLIDAQARLADAYLGTGRATEARVIAEDLMVRRPSVPENVTRFRRALEQLGEPDPDAIIASLLTGEESFGPYDTSVELVVPSPSSEPQPVAVVETDTGPVSALAAEDPADDVLVIESVEIDLSGALADLQAAVPVRAPTPTADNADDRDIDAVFADMRDRMAQADEAEAQLRRATTHLDAGRIDKGIADLESAAKTPVVRFRAASALGRLYVRRGELPRGIEWLERAAEAPAPTDEEGYGLLFELADALEHLGEGARALAILMELEAHAPGYRDVAKRVDRLARAQTGDSAS